MAMMFSRLVLTISAISICGIVAVDAFAFTASYPNDIYGATPGIYQPEFGGQQSDPNGLQNQFDFSVTQEVPQPDHALQSGQGVTATSQPAKPGSGINWGKLWDNTLGGGRLSPNGATVPPSNYHPPAVTEGQHYLPEEHDQQNQHQGTQGTHAPPYDPHHAVTQDFGNHPIVNGGDTPQVPYHHHIDLGYSSAPETQQQAASAGHPNQGFPVTANPNQPQGIQDRGQGGQQQRGSEHQERQQQLPWQNGHQAVSAASGHTRAAAAPVNRQQQQQQQQQRGSEQGEQQQQQGQWANHGFATSQPNFPGHHPGLTGGTVPPQGHQAQGEQQHGSEQDQSHYNPHPSASPYDHHQQGHTEVTHGAHPQDDHQGYNYHTEAPHIGQEHHTESHHDGGNYGVTGHSALPNHGAFGHTQAVSQGGGFEQQHPLTSLPHFENNPSAQPNHGYPQNGATSRPHQQGQWWNRASPANGAPVNNHGFTAVQQHGVTRPSVPGGREQFFGRATQPHQQGQGQRQHGFGVSAQPGGRLGVSRGPVIRQAATGFPGGANRRPQGTSHTRSPFGVSRAAHPTARPNNPHQPNGAVTGASRPAVHAATRGENPQGRVSARVRPALGVTQGFPGNRGGRRPGQAGQQQQQQQQQQNWSAGPRRPQSPAVTGPPLITVPVVPAGVTGHPLLQPQGAALIHEVQVAANNLAKEVHAQKAQANAAPGAPLPPTLVNRVKSFVANANSVIQRFFGRVLQQNKQGAGGHQ